VNSISANWQYTVPKESN